MQPEDVRKLSPEARLLYWIKERYAIYRRRQAGKPRPWTDDPILQSVFFTNVHRENDKVTVWVRQNLREPLANRPDRLLFAILAFRWFNYIPTGEYLNELGFLTDWDTSAVVQSLTERKATGEQVFTGAFNISNSGSPKPKINRVCEDYIAPAWEACGPDGWIREEILRGAFESKATLAGACDLLKTLPGLGGSGFMAAQVVCDLKYTKYLSNAPDWWTWSSPGPGSRRGINLVLGRPVEAPAPKDWDGEVNALRQRLRPSLRSIPPLHAQDLQNCLCEFFKFQRALEGGHSKRRYPGGAHGRP